MRNGLFFILAFILTLNSCKSDGKSSNFFNIRNFDRQIKEITIESYGKKFKIWTERIGKNPTAKILLLNGGPGLTHEYLECFEQQLPTAGYEIIYYDQLGCGNSDNPKDAAYWQLPRYVEEVEQIRKALGLDSTNFYLFGHSWGGILGMEYALKYQQHLKGLIISNMMSDGAAYDAYADTVLSLQMKPEVVAEIKALEAKNDYNNHRYMELLMDNYYIAHICRMPKDSWPEPVNRSFSKLNQSLYVTMQGPSEFGLAGNLTNWTVSNRLKELKIPVLFIGAKYDTMDPRYMEWMATQPENGYYWYSAYGSHMAMYDDQKNYFNGILEFLKKTNSTH